MEIVQLCKSLALAKQTKTLKAAHFLVDFIGKFRRVKTILCGDDYNAFLEMYRSCTRLRSHRRCPLCSVGRGHVCKIKDCFLDSLEATVCVCMYADQPEAALTAELDAITH